MEGCSWFHSSVNRWSSMRMQIWVVWRQDGEEREEEDPTRLDVDGAADVLCQCVSKQMSHHR